MSEKKKWSDLSKRQQQLVILGGAAEVVLTTICLVDIARRDRALVRGPKPLWVASFVVQPVGPLAYLLVGRRSASRPAITKAAV